MRLGKAILGTKEPRKCVLPPAIRVKASTPAQSSAAPSTLVTSTETSGPVQGVKTLIAALTSFKKKGPTQDKIVPFAPHPSIEGQISREAKKNKEPKELGKKQPK